MTFSAHFDDDVQVGQLSVSIKVDQHVVSVQLPTDVDQLDDPVANHRLIVVGERTNELPLQADGPLRSAFRDE